MAIIKKVDRRAEQKKLLGVKISKRIVQELKRYSDYVGLPINYCAEKLLEYALSAESEFQTNKASARSAKNGSTEEKAWKAFVSLGKTSIEGKSTDGSVHHDSYLYSLREKK